MNQSLESVSYCIVGVFICPVKEGQNRLIDSSAGIPPMLLYRAATGRVEEILIEGMPLGYSSLAEYEQHEYELAPGDTLLLMSDGLPERLNGSDEEYGYPRVEALFGEMATDGPDAIIQRLVQGGEQWADGRPQDDDITLVVLKVKG